MRENIETNAPDQPEKTSIVKTRIELRKESGKTYARADIPFAEMNLPAAVSYDGETYFRLGATKIYKTAPIFFLVPDNFEGGDPSLNSDLTNYDNARAFAQLAKDHAAEGQVSTTDPSLFDTMFSRESLEAAVESKLRADNKIIKSSMWTEAGLLLQTEEIA